MVSFRDKFVSGLTARGWQTTSEYQPGFCRAILVIGGTRRLLDVYRARHEGLPVIQRLDGLNWLHRRLDTGMRHYLRSEYGNLLLNFVRTHLADRLIYQSRFARKWWENEYGSPDKKAIVVHNGVDLEIYSDRGDHQRPINFYRLLLVEGSLKGGYEFGLATAIDLTRRLRQKFGLNLELSVAGRIEPDEQKHWSGQFDVPIRWEGLVPATQIPALDRSAHLLYSADLQAACPNAVVEALSCGLPVLAFDTGALNELVDKSSGRVVPYGGDPWKLDPPAMEDLAAGAVEIIQNNSEFRVGARRRAENHFALSDMIDRYLEFLLE